MGWKSGLFRNSLPDADVLTVPRLQVVENPPSLEGRKPKEDLPHIAKYVGSGNSLASYLRLALSRLPDLD